GADELNVKGVSAGYLKNRLRHLRVKLATCELKWSGKGEQVLGRTELAELLSLEHALAVALGAGEIVGQGGKPAKDQHHRHPLALGAGQNGQEEAERELTMIGRVAQD